MDGRPQDGALQELLREQLDSARRVLELNRAISLKLSGENVKSHKINLIDGHASADEPLTSRLSDEEDPMAVRLGQLAKAVQRFESQDYTPDAVTRSAEVAGQTMSPRLDLSVPLLAGNSQQWTVRTDKSGGMSDQRTVIRTKSRRRTSTIFPNLEEIKKQLKESLLEPEYNVEKFYHDKGCSQALATSDAFKTMAFLAIFLNAIWIAIDVDTNKADVLIDAPILNQVVENLFCCFFLMELLIRFGAFRNKCHALQDGWFLFDFLMVILMVWGTWVNVLLYLYLEGANQYSQLASYSSIFRVFRLFRLTRIARLARLLRDIPELMILVKGMFLAMRSVFSTLCMLLLIIYFFALFFTQLLWDQEAGKGCFENVPQAMNCLLLDGVFADQASFIRKMLAAGWLYYALILMYLVMGTMTILNMLIGILCEVVSVAAQLEKEEGLVQRVKDKLKEVLPEIDKDADARISKDEFKHLMTSRNALKELARLDVDVVAMVELADAIFYEVDDLGFEDFVKTVLQLRGTNTATVKDLVDVRKFFSVELVKLEERLLISIGDGPLEADENDESIEGT